MASGKDGTPSGLVVLGVVLGALVGYLYALHGSDFGWPALRAFIIVALVFVVFFAVLEIALYIVAGVLVLAFGYFYLTDLGRIERLSAQTRDLGRSVCESALAEWRDTAPHGWVCDPEGP